MIPESLSYRPARLALTRVAAAIGVVLALAAPSAAQSIAGYSDYYIPGPEGTQTGTSTQLGTWYILNNLDGGATATMRSVIAVTSWSPDTIVYYEHWEDGDGLDFDPDDPLNTADERFVLNNPGDILTLESQNIPTTLPYPANTTYYGGGDRLYVAGGTVTVTRSAWIQGRGAGNQALSWEIFPVRPQLTTYVLPFGEDLPGTGANFTGFERVYALIQATQDGTTFQVDVDGNGTFDLLNQNHDDDRTDPGDTATVTLNAGETFLLDQVSACPSGTTCLTGETLNTGTRIVGNSTLQVKFVAGDPGRTYCARGLSAFPRGFWTTDYYAPLDHATGGGGGETDYYLHNPHSTPITVSWQSATTANSFQIPGNTTVSFRAAAGVNVPVDSGLYFSGTDTFWGVGLNDSVTPLGATYEWGFSLLPSTFLYAEHFLGWAPGYASWDGGGGGNFDDVGIFLTVAQDNTRVFVDHDNDGVADQTFTLNRLETQYIYDASDGDLSQTHIWATGDFTMAYGENSDTAGTSVPSMDLGYVAIPGTDFIDLVLGVTKQANPPVVPGTTGSTTVFTLVTRAGKYPVDEVSKVDTLPPGWEFVPDSAVITQPDLTTVSGAAANPTITGAGTPASPYVLTWSFSQLGTAAMLPGQEARVEFTARVMAPGLATGDLSRNRVASTGTRTIVQGFTSETQTFTATDFDFVVTGDLTIDKTSSAPVPLYPGDQFTYTVTVGNSSGSVTQTGVSLFDAIPEGTSYVGGSGQVTCEEPENVRDEFGTVAYTNDDGSQNWAGAWSETDDLGGGAASGAIRVTGGALRFVYGSALGYVRDEFNTNGSGAGNDGSVDWAGDWTETGDNGDFSSGDIVVSGNRILFNGGAADGDSFQRDVAITGATSATVSFYFEDSDTTFAGFDDAIVEYSVDGGGYTSLFVDPFSANTPHGYYSSTITGLSGDVLTLRFRLLQPIEGADENRFDDVQVDLRPFVLDQFSSAGSGAGDDGTASWANDWTENDSGNGGTNFNAGNIEIEEGRLEFQNTTNAGDYAVRSVDVSGRDGVATLSFDWVSNGLEANDDILVQYALDAGGFVTLLVQDGASGDGSYSANIGLSGNTTLTLRIFAEDDLENDPGPGPAEEAWFDNIRLALPGTAGGGPVAGDRAARSADLSSATAATLTFSSATSGTLDPGDVVQVWIDDDATFGGDSVLLQSVADDGAFTGTYDISAYASANTTVFFVVNAGIDASDEWRSFDDVDISYWVPSSFASGAPPEFLPSTPGCSIRPGGTVTLTFDVVVDDPFPTGQDEITNTGATTTTLFPIQITDSVTDIVVVPSSGSATAGDRVWLDADGDGVFDPGETGLSGVEVTLKDQFGTPLQVTTTDSQGRYLFVDVAPGVDYYVEITDGLPAGLTQTTDGRTDERTDAFDLVPGQDYLDADLGFRASPGTAVLGDIAWIDVDSDQLRDAGEAGLAGVTVELYEDVNGNGIVDGPDGPPIATQVTGPAGGYLFTGIPADGVLDYLVAVDTGQAALTGYTATTITTYSYLNLPSQATRVDADFGFVPGAGVAYSISDRVWFDNGSGGGTAANGVQDGTEPGIAGVTVALLDASGTTIATTVTGPNGDFSFHGAPAGANYRWTITDDDHVLADLYGTTASALAGQFQMVGPLGSNLDYTSTPHFGYNASRAIGDTVYNDLDGDGMQDPGEAGIGGVTVLLYEDDGDGIFEPGGDDGAAVASLVTSPTGFYLFSGLADGTYFVSIDPTQPALANFDVLTTGDQEAAAGHQRQVTLAGGASQLDEDFGYRSTASFTVSGRLWNDANNNGADDGEPGFGNVTLELVSGGSVVATTTSNTNGNYSFAGLPAGTYTVRFTDNAGVLTGYTTTYELTEGALAGSYNGQETVAVGPSATNLHFGFYNPFRALTLAIVSSFNAHDESGAVVIEWETSAEIGTIGFELLRYDGERRDWVLLNDALLPALIGNRQGGTYRFVDEGARPGVTYRYLLIEVEASGRLNPLGPYRVNTDDTWDDRDSGQRRVALGHALGRGFARDARVNKQRHWGTKGFERRWAERKSSWRERWRDRLRDWRRGQQANEPEVRISVSGTGIVYVPLAEAQEAGLTDARRLQLSHHGSDVAYAPSADGSGLYFYAQPFESAYTEQDVYWLGSGGRGRPGTMAVRSDRGRTPSGGETFLRNVHAEQDLFPSPSLFADPDADWSLWDYLFAGGGARNYGFQAAGAAGTGQASLTVRLQGGRQSAVDPDHHVRIRLNGQQIGEVWLDDLDASETQHGFDASLLVDGQNTLALEALSDTGAPYSLVYLDSFTVSYPSRYVAEADRLECSTGDNRSVLLSGFTSADVMVFDVSVPTQPVQVRAEAALLPDGSYGVALSPPKRNTLYYALTSQALLAGFVEGEVPSTLKTKRNRAEYLIVTTAELVETAQTLADYRGMTSMVVDIQDVYDEFGHGVASPHALKAFFAYAWKEWEVAPRYVVLAGDGSWDYKDAYGYGPGLIPPALVATPDGLATSDLWYADVDPADVAPEFAIGRLPVNDAEELADMIRKIQDREGQGGDWLRKLVAVADNPDSMGNFNADSDRLVALAPPDLTVERIYMPAVSASQARTRLRAAINAGAGMVSYVGHAGYDVLADERILRASDIAALTNHDQPTILTAMTCVAGDFGQPFLDSLAELLVQAPGGGAAAVWAPTSLSDNEHAVALAEAYYAAAFAGGDVRIGDAILAALEAYEGTWRPEYLLRIYGLIGDPATRLE